MSKFQFMINGERSQSFNFLLSALEYMASYIKTELDEHEENHNQYELIYENDNQTNSLVRFLEKKDSVKIKDFHPFLQRIMERGIFDKEGYLHEINHSLLILDQLENKKYTSIKGNDNFLDLIKFVDITEFNLVYCQNCRTVQQCTIEGCDDAIFVTCDNCNQVIFEAFRKK